ncbi:recombinase family protein [Streptomyces tauricus]
MLICEHIHAPRRSITTADDHGGVVRVMGLTLAVPAVDKLLGFPYPDSLQEQDLRDWARRNNHELSAIYAAGSQAAWRMGGWLTQEPGLSLILPKACFADLPFLFPYELCLPQFAGRVLATDTDGIVPLSQRMGAMLHATWDSDEGDRRPRPQIEPMKAGRRRKHEQGGYAYGAPPYGWVAVEGGLAPDPTEQEARTRAMQLRDQGLPLRTVCSMLDAEGHRTRSGRPWSSGTLSRILDRPPPPSESIVGLTIVPWPRHRDGSRGSGRLKLRRIGDSAES